MASKTINPPNDFAFATPTMYVDVYTSVSNPSKSVTLTPGNLLSLSVSKYIRGDVNSGRFSFSLAPGGVNGPDDPITWIKILNQYSLCVIYGKRGQSSAIIMVGLISSIKETQIWNNESVRRITEVEGFDFTLYFTTFAYYVLNYLGYIYTLPGLFGPPGVTNGVLEGSPDKVGASWFTRQFLGQLGQTPQGALQNTFITYQGNNIPINQIFGFWFEAYTSLLGTPAIFPMLTDFLISEGTFYDKFVQIFPFPFYELFVNTVPHNYYPNAQLASVQIGTQLQGFGTSDVVAVARVNPVVCADVDATGKFILRRDRWDQLTKYSLTPYSFIESQVEYNIDDIKNFFVIAPMGPLTVPGGAPGNSLVSSVQQMGVMYDTDSINKYGFRSEVESIIWWVDPVDSIMASALATSGVNVPSIVQYQSFLLKTASYYEPMPIMLRGAARMPMWPEIIAGNQFEYLPYKDSVPYTFYITGVEHTYTFREDSYTTVYLERGLPSAIYVDNDPLLLQIHLGQTEKIDGNIVPTSGLGIKYNNLSTIDPWASFPGMGAFGNTVTGPANIAGLPSNTNNSHDADFQNAVAAIGCSQPIDWRVLKALAMTETTPAMVPPATPTVSKGVTYYGIMQVNPASAPPGFQDPTQLNTNPTYNIHAGAYILCQMLNSSNNPTHSMRTALALYKGANPSLGFNDPAVRSSPTGPTNWGSVDAAMQFAQFLGVPQIV